FPTSAGRNPPPGPAHRAVPTLWSELPKIFLGDVLGHQFGQHLVFGLDLFFQKLDPLLFRLVIWTALALEGGRTILEELLLPSVEHRWRQPQFITPIGNRHLIQQVRLRMATFSSPV